MAQPLNSRSRSSRTKLTRWLVAIGVLLLVLAIVATVVATHFSPILRERAIQALSDRYQCDVKLADLHISLFPRVTVSGDGLEMRKRDRPGGGPGDPPMVVIRHFVGHTDFLALIGKPMHVHRVELDGLRLALPHKRSDDEKTSAPPPSQNASSKPSALVVDQIRADGTFLEILPKESGKVPLQFQISKLNLHSVGRDRPMEFQATLTNPKPPGLIQSTGHFGPWHNDEPGDTPVDGHYTFNNADLGVFKGISGTLSSTGDYHGQLNQISVKGTTDTPNFTVSTGGHPVDLVTEFDATVNGTDGNTYLHPVKARFLQTHMICQGEVEHKTGTAGKTVALDVTITQGRIEDLLRLVVKGDPLMDGPAQLKAKLLIPPGKDSVMDRIQLDGQFGVAQATFTKNNLQEKITDLSLRAQGRAGEAKEKNVGADAQAPEHVASDFKATLGVKNGTATFSELRFQVPGANLALSGSYGLSSEKLDFRGKFLMDAKVSQAFTGWKSLLLKAADPFFSKNGSGAEVPLVISGTRKNPLIGLQLFHRDNQQAHQPSKPNPKNAR